MLIAVRPDCQHPRFGIDNDVVRAPIGAAFLRLSQDRQHIFVERFPKSIVGVRIQPRRGGVVAAAARSRSAAAASIVDTATTGGRDPCSNIDSGLDIARKINVADVIGAEIRVIRGHHDGATFDAVAEIDLSRDAVEDLRQGLIDGIEGDIAADVAGDVYIELGVAGEGEQQLAHGNVVDDHGVALAFRHRGGRRHEWRAADDFGDVGVAHGSRFEVAGPGFSRLWCHLRAATQREQRQRRENQSGNHWLRPAPLRAPQIPNIAHEYLNATY